MSRKVKRKEQKKAQNRKLNIQILLLTILIVLGSFTAQGMAGSIISSLGLDQDAQCGKTEHIHDDSCYNNWDILECELETHIHSSECYMVLLEDNDINTLLEEVDAAEDHSLNNLVSQKVTRNTAAGSNYTGENTDRNSSALVLNNNAAAAAAAAETGSGGASTYALGDSVSTSGRYANFYVWLDGSWTFIGDISWSRNNRNISVDSIVSLLNSSLGTSLTKGSFDIVWSKSTNGTSGTEVDIMTSTNTVTLSTDRSDSNPTYVHIVADKGDWNNTGISFNTVIYNYQSGKTETEYVRTGTSVKLPSTSYSWVANGTDIYSGGADVDIYEKTIFNEDNGKFRISYDVNFPTSVGGITITNKATVMGVEKYSVQVDEGQIATIFNVSESTIENSYPNMSPGQTRVFKFMGWNVAGTETILQPGAKLTWEALKKYGISLTLNGVWECAPLQSVSFFVKYNSVILESDGTISEDPNLYTPQIYAAFVRGDDVKNLTVSQLNSLYRVESGTASAEVDTHIRQYYGESEDESERGMWLDSFPSDEYVFNELKKYASDLSVDGIPVKTEDLNDHGYTIRWYVFKAQNDAWHVDGALIRKEGLLDVSKSFAGNKEAIEAVKAGDFYIEAQSGSRTVLLNLRNYKDYDPVTDTYYWQIEDITYGEKWKLRELNYGSSYAEYTIVDASGVQSAHGRFTGEPIEITGMTYAMDLGPEIMSVDFTNIYKGSDSIVIKKEDTQTKRPLAGAGFQLMQNGKLLKFDHNEDTNVYACAENGQISEVSGGVTGYVEISVTGLDFSQGPITVHESTVPDGYSIRDDIVLEKVNDQIRISSGDDARIEDSVLIIGNSSDIVRVTVEKTWSDIRHAQDVTVQLLANDRLVSTLVSGAQSEAVLNEANGYSYSWDNLPRYANGQKVNWSVREVQIGSEQCKPDYTFANWIVTYGNPQETVSGGEYSTKLLVTNTRKDTVTLLVFKVNDTDVRIAGAEFKLELLLDNGSVNNAFEPQTLTTESTGLLSFSNLPYGKYRLTETKAPPGYYALNEPIYLQISDDHRVSIISGSNVTVTSAVNLTIKVVNHSSTPLPQTGGDGTSGFTPAAAGIAVMLFAGLAALINFVMHRRVMRS